MSDDPRTGAPGSTCPWCSARVAAGAGRCSSCGAAIAQRDDLAGLVIPGVTAVDPNLVVEGSSLANPMLRTQGTANVLFATTQVNAAVGMAAAAAVLGQDMLKGMLGGHDVDPASVGVPSEAALKAAERLERDEAPDGEQPAPPDASLPDPWADLPAG
jgi:hypothetical protein